MAPTEKAENALLTRCRTQPSTNFTGDLLMLQHTISRLLPVYGGSEDGAPVLTVAETRQRDQLELPMLDRAADVTFSRKIS